jgi:hypothetical protein
MATLPCLDCGRLIQVPRGYDRAWHADGIAAVRLAWMDATEQEGQLLMNVAARVTREKTTL